MCVSVSWWVIICKLHYVQIYDLFLGTVNIIELKYIKEENSLIFGKLTKILKGSLNSLLFLKTSHHASGFPLLTSLPNTVPSWCFRILCPFTPLVPLSHLFSRPFQFCLCTHHYIQHINRPLTKKRKHKTLIPRESLGSL